MASDLQISTPIIDGLKTEIWNRHEKHKDVGRKAATFILETLENAVRIGWCLLDIKRELRGAQGAYEAFVETHLPIGAHQALNYARVSRSFDRDEENWEFTQAIRKAAGLDPLLLEVAVSRSLKQQILEIKANSFSDMMRASGIAKPKTIRDKELSIAAKPSFLRIGKAINSAWVKIQRTNDIATWGEQERKTVREDLKPLVDFYESLV